MYLLEGINVRVFLLPIFICPPESTLLCPTAVDGGICCDKSNSHVIMFDFSAVGAMTRFICSILNSIPCLYLFLPLCYIDTRTD